MAKIFLDKKKEIRRGVKFWAKVYTGRYTQVRTGLWLPGRQIDDDSRPQEREQAQDNHRSRAGKKKDCRDWGANKVYDNDGIDKKNFHALQKKFRCWYIFKEYKFKNSKVQPKRGATNYFHIVDSGKNGQNLG